MNTQANNLLSQIASLQKDPAIIAGFSALVKTSETMSGQMDTQAKLMAAQVAPYGMKKTTAIGALESVYTAEFKALSANRNTVAQLRACLWMQIAGDLLVEVTPPSKDGKTAAVFKPAKDLTPKQAKVHLAVVKNDIAEQEATPEEKARKEAEAAKVKADAQAKANAMATAAAKLKADEAWAYCLADANRATLVTKLADIGYKLAKLTTAPKG